jgi:hypothetical protein
MHEFGEAQNGNERKFYRKKHLSFKRASNIQYQKDDIILGL